MKKRKFRAISIIFVICIVLGSLGFGYYFLFMNLGDCLCFRLPNSGISINISYKHWHRIDASKRGEPLTPDYQVSASKALNKVYELIEKGY